MWGSYSKPWGQLRGEGLGQIRKEHCSEQSTEREGREGSDALECRGHMGESVRKEKADKDFTVANQYET